MGSSYDAIQIGTNFSFATQSPEKVFFDMLENLPKSKYSIENELDWV